MLTCMRCHFEDVKRHLVADTSISSADSRFLEDFVEAATGTVCNGAGPI